jgi:hypothetical protein
MNINNEHRLLLAIISTPFYFCMVSPLHVTTTWLEVKLSLYTTCTSMQRAEVQLHSFLTSAVDGVSGQLHDHITLLPTMGYLIPT